MFSLTQRFDEKQCAYIYSVISVKNLIVKVMFKKNKRRRRKSMYSDYASGIAFLIKTNSSIKGWCHDQQSCVWSSCLNSGALYRPLWKVPGTMIEEFEASQPAGLSDRKRRGKCKSRLIGPPLGNVLHRYCVCKPCTCLHTYCLTLYILLKLYFWISKLFAK